ncbi:MAG: nitrogenase iron-molybdenum cofactor biosynthesis protein NifN [Azoarcus sp.]|jgi:nitrogenase molybdenum-iron protein NifN|nr:nitrogenase iron-molybdenum cofactor biosynthesis protein NifN [Azoarcus sp.]
MANFQVKPLCVSPLKTSQPLGAALAFLGLDRAVPLMHGSQGCAAFGKVFFVRHFREPVPLQVTAMDQISSIMGAGENVIEALRAICDRDRPDIIGLVTTGLSEVQGSDVRRAVRDFRARYPEFGRVAIVEVDTPDFVGCLESGFALALEAIIEALAPKGADAGRRARQVNVLASAMLTPGDIEAIREWVEAFGLTPVILPDIGDSLDGHLAAAEFSPLTIGGAKVAGIATMGASMASLVIGSSLGRAADTLKARTGVPDYRFAGLMGLADCDAFTDALARISACPVPAKVERWRDRLRDAMVDSHFMLGFARLALAENPDLLLMLERFLRGMGAEVVAAVSPVRAASLEGLRAPVTVGDLEDLERLARERGADLIIANSHGADTARRLNLPLLRAGFPQYDHVGGPARAWVGYRGSRQALFDLANLLSTRRHEIEPYRSLYRQDALRAGDAGAAAHAGAPAHC